MAKELLKGNVAFAEAAERAGCEAYFGYPITPQTEALDRSFRAYVATHSRTGASVYPGLGNIAPSQGDFFQIAKGGGHGDYRMIVLAPATVQEFIDLTVEAFDLAEKYRNIVTILADASLGQMMEPAELPPMRPMRRFADRPDWALTGADGREPNIITSIYIDPAEMEVFNLKLIGGVVKISPRSLSTTQYTE